ncbi:unnamed protein product [Arabis nemorensis]|uniref:Uncharacterized protein n=1 Tax=Arabis nemorensis TaxID=586526 RepID=A0A565CFY9_9BRAS|nr:unnamed protein product [Arabis nemorensis]
MAPSSWHSVVSLSFHSCDPKPGQGQDHDASESAAVVAANLLSSARLELKLDSVFTEYSAQYLLDNACPNKVDGEGETDRQGIPRADQWVHLGCQYKPPTSAYNPALVSMKGELVEAMNVDEVLKLLKQQPVGARMHAFSPEPDFLVEKINHHVPPGMTRYVGLRDVIIFGVEEVEGKMIAKVKLYHKKKFAFIKVAMDSSVQVSKHGGPAYYGAESKLLVDFCVRSYPSTEPELRSR